MSRTRSRRELAADVGRLVEEHAEAMAPAIARNPVVASDGTVLRGPLVEADEWRDPDDDDPRARAPRMIRGFSRVDVLRNLHLRRGLVTTAHLADARRFAGDYEIGMGARPGYERPEAGTGVPSFGLGQTQLDALDRFHAACEAVGVRGCSVLVPVAVANHDLGTVARARGVSTDVAHGLLVAALDRLGEHYDDAGVRDDDGSQNCA